MCAYNSINGQPACANEFLLQDQCAASGDSKGYVVSDCEAVRDIFAATTMSRPRRRLGDQLEARHGQRVYRLQRQGDGRPRLQAVSRRGEAGHLKESEIDAAVMRLFTARMKLGMFDPPARVPYAKIDEKRTEQCRSTASWRESWRTSRWCCSRTMACCR